MPDDPAAGPPPFESCIGCSKGDTGTGFALRGEAEWMIAAISVMAGVPLAEAHATFAAYAREEFGGDPGRAPVGEITLSIRLCRDCGKRTGMEVSDMRSGKVLLYAQPGGTS